MTRSRQTADWGSRAGLAKIIPSSVAVGSGTGSADSTGKVSFSGVSSVSLNGVFSSAYENYRILVNYRNATSNPLNMRLRVSGTDASGATDYHIWGQYGNAGSATQTVGAAKTSTWEIGYATNTIETAYSTVELKSPFNSGRRTGIYQHSQQYNNTNFEAVQYSGGHLQLASYDGFTIYQPSGTLTGEVTVYGYN